MAARGRVSHGRSWRGEREGGREGRTRELELAAGVRVLLGPTMPIHLPPRRHALVVRIGAFALCIAVSLIVAVVREPPPPRRTVLGLLGVLGLLLAVRERAADHLRAGDVREVLVLGEEGRDEGGRVQLALLERLELLLVDCGQEEGRQLCAHRRREAREEKGTHWRAPSTAHSAPRTASTPRPPGRRRSRSRARAHGRAAQRSASTGAATCR